MKRIVLSLFALGMVVLGLARRRGQPSISRSE